jgi:hypothetical protein
MGLESSGRLSMIGLFALALSATQYHFYPWTVPKYFSVEKKKKT